MSFEEQSPYSVAIVGAGFSGMCAAMQLQKQMNFRNFTIFEALHDFGGTWLSNNYPGCACDVQSHLYSFSFELNPEWSQNYSSSAEICAYMKKIARKYGLYDKTEFNTAVTSLKWIPNMSKWAVSTFHKKTQATHTYHYNFVFSGTGILRAPHIPENFKNFQETLIHSAEWPSKKVDFEGKKVGIVGSGSSAVQIIPEIADRIGDTGELHCFQKSPAYVLNKIQFRFPTAVKWIFANIPFILVLYRFLIYIFNEVTYVAFLSNRFSRWAGTKLCETNMKSHLDESKWEELTPNYTPGCKRFAVSNTYFPSLNKPNVKVHRELIKTVEKGSIVLENGAELKLDILILATGFKTQEFFAPMEIFGKGETDLLQEWKKKGPITYYGVVCDLAPNLIFVQGPNSILGHNSVVFMTECQVNFAVQLVNKCVSAKRNFFCLKKDIGEKWIDYMKKKFVGTVWTENCGSWYADKMGRITTLWPMSATSFYMQTRKVNFENFNFG